MYRVLYTNPVYIFRTNLCIRVIPLILAQFAFRRKKNRRASVRFWRLSFYGNTRLKELSQTEWYHYRLVSNEQVSKYCFCWTPQMPNFILKKHEIFNYRICSLRRYLLSTLRVSSVKRAMCRGGVKNCRWHAKWWSPYGMHMHTTVYSCASDIQCMWFDLSFVILIWSVCRILDIRRIAMWVCVDGGEKRTHTNKFIADKNHHSCWRTYMHW